MENEVKMPEMAKKVEQQVAVQTTNEGPVKKFKNGAIIATVWKNQYKDKMGMDQTIHSVTVARVYKKNDEDEWNETNSFNVADLPKVNSVVNAAYNWLAVVDVDLNKKE